MTQALKKGVRVELGSSTYILPPATIATLEDFSERLDAFNAKFAKQEEFKTADLGIVADLIHACLLRNYPEITRRTIAEQVDLGNFMDLMASALDISGLLRKAQEQEDQASQAASPAASEGGTLGELTGMASLPTS